MKQPRLRTVVMAVWSVLTYVLCWLWLSAQVEWSRKCGPEPALDYPYLSDTCADMADLRNVWALPALAALLGLALIFIRAAIGRPPQTGPRSGFWSSPLAALGSAFALWGLFFGSMWLTYRLDHDRTCDDPDGPLFHAPYCADLERALRDFGYGSFPAMALGLLMLCVYALRTRSRPA